MIKNLQLSLVDIVGAEYIDKVCRATAKLNGSNAAELRAVAEKKVDF